MSQTCNIVTTVGIPLIELFEIPAKTLRIKVK